MRVVFVCTGNTCRSPLAAALLRQQAPQVEVLSAGVMAIPGSPAAAEALALAAELGSDLSAHRAQQLSAEHVQGSLLLTLTGAHRDAVLKRFPEARPRLFSLGEYAGEDDHDVADPIGRGMSAYRQTAEEIADLIGGARRRLGWLFLGAVGIAADSAGGPVHADMIRHLMRACVPTIDLGVAQDWQAAARSAAVSVQRGDVAAALTGSTCPSGAAVAANRFRGVRAVHAVDAQAARAARSVLDANHLCLDAVTPGRDSVREIAASFLHTEANDPGVGLRIDEYTEETPHRPRP